MTEIVENRSGIWGFRSNGDAMTNKYGNRVIDRFDGLVYWDNEWAIDREIALFGRCDFSIDTERVRGVMRTELERARDRDRDRRRKEYNRLDFARQKAVPHSGREGYPSGKRAEYHEVPVCLNAGLGSKTTIRLKSVYAIVPYDVSGDVCELLSQISDRDYTMASKEVEGYEGFPSFRKSLLEMDGPGKLGGWLDMDNGILFFTDWNLFDRAAQFLRIEHNITPQPDWVSHGTDWCDAPFDRPREVKNPNPLLASSL